MESEKESLPQKDSCVLFIDRGEFSNQHQPPHKHISIHIECLEQIMPMVTTSLSTQLRFETLKTPHKYKSSDLSSITFEVSPFESESTKLEDFFKGMQDIEGKANHRMSVHVHPNLYELISVMPEIKGFVLGEWQGRVEMELVPPNTVEIKGEFPLESIINDRKELLICLKKTIVIKYSLEEIERYLPLFQHCPQLKTALSFTNPQSQCMYLYTKDSSQANRILKSLTNFQQKSIDLYSIFRDTSKYMFYKRFLLATDIQQHGNLIIIPEGDSLVVKGQIIDILGLQKHLHLRFINCTVKQVVVELTRVKLKVVNKYIKKANDTKGEVLVLHYLNFRELPHTLDVKMCSYDCMKLDQIYDKMLEQLGSIQFQLIDLPLPLSDKTKIQLMAKHHVDVAAQDNLVIVSGLPKDIESFRLELKSHPSQMQKLIPLPPQQQPQRVLTQIVYQLVLEKDVYARLVKEFGEEVRMENQELDNVQVVTVGITQPHSQRLVKLQGRILNFCLQNCHSPDHQIPFHSLDQRGVTEMGINEQNIEVLRQWNVGYRMVEKMVKVSDREYQSKYMLAKSNNTETSVWMTTPLSFNDTQPIIAHNIKQLGTLNRDNIVYNLIRFPFKVEQNMDTTLLLCSTFKTQTTPLQHYQFLPKYLLKLNPMAILLHHQNIPLESFDTS